MSLLRIKNADSRRKSFEVEFKGVTVGTISASGGSYEKQLQPIFIRMGIDLESVKMFEDATEEISKAISHYL